ncbi:hypothetical protein [Maribacter sp.]|uniref:hypothetical protein n=1 Tax=Maribacter sp. TaxID=1897614 RepID=UPI0025C6E5EE|nr:hypothetical protein [Maribacter sp.]
MIKLVSIVTSLLILIQSFQFSFVELMEMDELIEHAEFHANEYGDNFLVFLSKHYGELKAEHDKTSHGEKKEHEELPFQHAAHAPSLSVFVITYSSNYNTPSFLEQEYKTTNYHYIDSHSIYKKEGLLQPPRQA